MVFTFWITLKNLWAFVCTGGGTPNIFLASAAGNCANVT